MLRVPVISLAFLAAGSAPLLAQHEHGAAAPGRSPYAAFRGREIKALAPEEVERYRNAEGMGLALAGELNRYPGPKHVMELGDELHLSPRQRSRIAMIGTAMLNAARRIGEGIITHERLLDRAFATRQIDEEQLRRLLAEIARLQGELRFTHLKAHLDVTALLTPEQIERYDQLRGYADLNEPGRRRP